MPSAEQTTAVTSPAWPPKRCRSLPVASSQRHKGPAKLPVASVRLSGENARDSAGTLSHGKDCRVVPVATSTRNTVAASLLRWEPIAVTASTLPSAEKARRCRSSRSDKNWCKRWPVWRSHSRTAWSRFLPTLLAEASQRPSEDTASAEANAVWLFNS